MRRVRLTRKLAFALNGLDLSSFRVGDVLLLRASDAQMLIAEGWAEPLPEPPPERGATTRNPRESQSH